MNATFHEVYDKFIDMKKKTLSDNSIKTYLKVQQKVRIYEQKNKCTMYLSECTLGWFEKWTKGLTTGKYYCQ